MGIFRYWVKLYIATATHSFHFHVSIYMTLSSMRGSWFPYSIYSWASLKGNLSKVYKCLFVHSSGNALEKFQHGVGHVVDPPQQLYIKFTTRLSIKHANFYKATVLLTKCVKVSRIAPFVVHGWKFCGQTFWQTAPVENVQWGHWPSDLHRKKLTSRTIL